GSILAIGTCAASAAATAWTSPRRDGAPGYAISATPPATTAVSSTKQQSGKPSSAASSTSVIPSSPSALRYAACCARAVATSIVVGPDASAFANDAGTSRVIARATARVYHFPNLAGRAGAGSITLWHAPLDRRRARARRLRGTVREGRRRTPRAGGANRAA